MILQFLRQFISYTALAILLCMPSIGISAAYSSPIDSAIANCNQQELALLYDKYSSKQKMLSGDKAVEGNARLLRLAASLGRIDDVNMHWELIDTNKDYPTDIRSEIVKACSDIVKIGVAGIIYVHPKKCIPLFGANKKDAIFGSPEYDMLLGYVNMMINELSKATDNFNSAISRTSSSPTQSSGFYILEECILGKAEALIMAGDYERAEKCLDDFNPMATEFKNNPAIIARYHLLKGRLHHLLGDNISAGNELVCGRDLLVSNDAVSSPVYPSIIREMGINYMSEGKFEKALQSFDEYRKYVDSAYSKKSVLTVDAIGYQMDALNALCRYKEAKELEESSEITKFDLSYNPLGIFSVAHVYNACAEYMMGDNVPGIAAMLLSTSIDLYTSLGSENILECRNLYNSLGYAYTAADKHEAASEAFSKQLDIDRKFAHDIFLFLPESQRKVYWAKTEPFMNRLFLLNRLGSVTLPDGSVSEIKRDYYNDKTGATLYDASLLNKGLMLQATVNLRQMISENADNDLGKRTARLSEIRNKQALQGSLSAKEKEEAARIEKEIIAKSRKYGDFMEFANIKWKDIQNALKDNEIAVEFVMSKEGKTQYYSAEVIRKSYDTPKHVFLFGLRDNDKRFDKMNIYESMLLYNKVWKKIADLAMPGETIYFSPAGKFYNIAIEHAVTPDGSRINSQYNILRLSSTREILRNVPKGTKQSIVLYGGLNYDLGIEDMLLLAMEKEERHKPPRFRAGDFTTRDSWSYLPGTLKEINSIASNFNNKPGLRKSLLTGDAGTEESFKKLSKNSPEILHIATHGFYIPAKEIANNVIKARYSNTDNSLRRSALILSGGNNGWMFPELIPKGVEDGVLTAEEVADMDLSKTSLVVMSACQTGLGDISNEGVFGLQRAFKLAGAKTLIMSLAPVHDDATRMLMTEFYAQLFNGLSIRDAFKKAQEAVKFASFSENGTSISGSDPKFWAPFVIMD